MRHVIAAFAFAGALLAAGAGANALAARSDEPGIVWVILRAGGLQRVLASGDVRVMTMRGRLVQVYVPSLAKVRWPEGAVWGAWMLPAVFGIAGCG